MDKYEVVTILGGGAETEPEVSEGMDAAMALARETWAHAPKGAAAVEVRAIDLRDDGQTRAEITPAGEFFATEDDRPADVVRHDRR